jgi:hypothetical protein
MSEATVRRWRLLGGGTALLASLYHISLAAYLVTNQQFTTMTYGQDAGLEVPSFFLVLGAFQLTWAWETYREKQSIMIGIGTLGFLGSIVLYLVALATPLPLGVSQQTISTVALVAKVIEVAFVISSARLIRSLAQSTVKPHS